jgi:chemotaxis methyl-accepting protein methylase
MDISADFTARSFQSDRTEMADCARLSEVILPSLLLSPVERERFEVKSDKNQALREIREYGTLWRYTEVFRDPSISQLPQLLDSHPSHHIPIYSYGCSTGQEPYSLHLVLRQHFGVDYHTRFPIAAFDLDVHSLGMARSGCLLVESGEGASEMIQLLRLAASGIEIAEVLESTTLVKIPDHRRVTFSRGDVRKESFNFSGPVVIFLQNVLYHLVFDEQFAVMDRLCSLSAGSIVCLGSDTFTDRAAASILKTSKAFSRIGELKNVLIRRDPPIEPSATLREVV